MSRPRDGDGADWLGYGEAVRATLQRVSPLEAERLRLDRAAGRAAAEDVTSRLRHPPWDDSAMDGYAVRSRDVEGARPEAPVVLPVSGRRVAGDLPGEPLSPGTAVRVTTGAPVPADATGVIRVEHTDAEEGRDGHVAVRRASDAERNIRPAGEALEPGQTVLRRGDEIGAAAAGLLAASGHGEVAVHRPPRVGVLASGDELVDLERVEEARDGRRIVDANSHALAAALRRDGAIPVRLGIASDVPGEIETRLRQALDRMDAVVTTAGVSVGRRDHLKRTLERMGARRVFWRARIRPGNPILFALLGDLPLWALPGNPVSALVTYEVLVRPGLRRLSGFRRVRPSEAAVRAGQELTSPEELTHFLRVALRDGPDELPVAVPSGPRGSGILASQARADALLVVPESTSRLEEGEVGRALLLDAWREDADARQRPGAERPRPPG